MAVEPGVEAAERAGADAPSAPKPGCASDSTPGAGYRRFPGPAGGLAGGPRRIALAESLSLVHVAAVRMWPGIDAITTC